MIEVWTLKGCARCERAKAALNAAGLQYVELSLDDLRIGAIVDMAALTELAMCDGVAPLVRRGGRFLDDVEFEALLLGAEPA
jgi:arsenate reductase-like glutaredoxin family protein